MLIYLDTQYTIIVEVRHVCLSGAKKNDYNNKFDKQEEVFVIYISRGGGGGHFHIFGLRGCAALQGDFLLETMFAQGMFF